VVGADALEVGVELALGAEDALGCVVGAVLGTVVGAVDGSELGCSLADSCGVALGLALALGVGDLVARGSLTWVMVVPVPPERAWPEMSS